MEESKKFILYDEYGEILSLNNGRWPDKEVAIHPEAKGYIILSDGLENVDIEHFKKIYLNLETKNFDTKTDYDLKLPKEIMKGDKVEVTVPENGCLIINGAIPKPVELPIPICLLIEASSFTACVGF